MNTEEPLDDWAQRALGELAEALSRIEPEPVDELAKRLMTAKRIGLYGVGREGLMMRALTMRLYHLGLDAHMVGDVTMPPLAGGDCLVVSAGPGHFATVEALMRMARDQDAGVALLTAQNESELGRLAHVTIKLPAQTMAEGVRESAALTMGSAYEATQFLFFEYLVEKLRHRIPVTEAAMRSRHTNME